MDIKKLILSLLLVSAGTFAFAQNGGEPETPMYANAFVYEDAVPGTGGEPEPTRVINVSLGAAGGEAGEPSLDWDNIESIRMEDGMTEEVKDGVVYFLVLPQRYKDTALVVEKTTIGEEAQFVFSKTTKENETLLVLTSAGAQGAYITVYEGQNYKGEFGIQFVGSLNGEGRNLALLKLE